MELDKICSYFQVGTVTMGAERIYGGLLHRMYRIKTTSGTFALKELNAEIMKRPNAYRGMINSEIIARQAAAYFPAMTAIRPDNGGRESVLFFHNEMYYMMYPWFEGRPLKTTELTMAHSRRIGEILGRLHTIDFLSFGIEKPENESRAIIPWEEYLEKGQKQNKAWAHLLEKYRKRFEILTISSSKALVELSPFRVISHRDMDLKNVLWNGLEVMIIDWEATGFISKWQELIDMLICWSEDSDGQIDPDRVSALLEGYQLYGNLKGIDWDKAYVSNYIGKFDWLFYNIRRALGEETWDKEDCAAGDREVPKALNGILRYEAQIMELRQVLHGAHIF